ncbi:porin family protein [Flavitalea antarctica]
MKKLGMLLLPLAMTFAGNAQKTVTFGHTASIGNSWLSNGENFAPGYDNKEMHVSYGLGMRMVASFHPNWGIMSDLKFSSEGGAFGRDDSDARRVFRVNFLRHSLQGVYFFGERGNRVRPKISLGPSVGLFAGGKSMLKDGGTESMPDVKSKNIFKTWDFGLTGAAGVNVRLKESVWLNAEGAYYHGLTNANDLTSQKMQHRGLGFTLGLLMSPDYEKMKAHMEKHRNRQK